MDGQLQSETEHWSTTMNIPAAENTRIHTHIVTLESAENGVRMKLNLQTWADQQIPMICALTLGGSKIPEEGRPSLIIRPMDTDTLWSLAKETGSTMAAIRQANRLTQEPVQGQMLLIPVI
jgi:LysM repeat protein